MHRFEDLEHEELQQGLDLHQVVEAMASETPHLFDSNSDIDQTDFYKFTSTPKNQLTLIALQTVINFLFVFIICVACFKWRTLSPALLSMASSFLKADADNTFVHLWASSEQQITYNTSQILSLLFIGHCMPHFT